MAPNTTQAQLRLEALEERPPSAPPAASPAPQPGKVKLREPDVFDGSTDIRFWLLDMDDNIRERLITTDTSKIAFVVSYLAPKIRQRVQRMQLDHDMHVASWEVLKVWLCDNYRETNTALTAELRMNSLRMQYSQRAIDFIADFETLAADLRWNDPAICSMFRTKLTAPILRQINQAYFNAWPATFADWKKAVITAESHIAMSKQLIPNNKHVKFDLTRDTRERDSSLMNNRARSRSPERSPRGTNKNPDITDT
ncbi:hypothetical protein ACJ73_10374, partial [Blastomyces percursus]